MADGSCYAWMLSSLFLNISINCFNFNASIIFTLSYYKTTFIITAILKIIMIKQNNSFYTKRIKGIYCIIDFSKAFNTIDFRFRSTALESSMCDVIKICLKCRDATRSGKGNQTLNIKNSFRVANCKARINKF